MGGLPTATSIWLPLEDSWALRMNNSRPATDSLAKMTLQVAALLTDGLINGPTACNVLASTLAKASSNLQLFGFPSLEIAQVYDNKILNEFEHGTHHPDQPPESLNIFCSSLRRSVDNERISLELCRATVSEMARPPSRSKLLTCQPTLLRLEALMQAPVHLHNSIKRYSFIFLCLFVDEAVSKMKTDQGLCTSYRTRRNHHLTAPRRIRAKVSCRKLWRDPQHYRE